jgi:hypothetical protein
MWYLIIKNWKLIVMARNVTDSSAAVLTFNVFF